MEHSGPSKTTRAIYWASTLIFAALMLSSAYAYLNNPGAKAAFVHLGFPPYFRVELAVLKIIGAFALILRISPAVKSWAYAGFCFTLISAVVAHWAVGDGPRFYLMPVLVFGILMISRFTYSKVRGFGV